MRIRLLIALLCSLTLVGCGSKSSSSSQTPQGNQPSSTSTVPVLAQIVVKPATGSVPVGITQQFTAIGIWTDNSTQDITSEVTWSSSDTTHATVSAGGLATGVNPTASVTISAKKNGVTGTAALSVSSASLTAVSVAPDAAFIPVGANQQFSAVGTYSDSTTNDITALLNWISDKSGVASVAANTGLALGVSPGVANITASSQGSPSQSDTSVLTVVNASLVSIQINPPNPTVSLSSGPQQFTASGTYTDGSVQDITATVTWSSSHLEFASINASGLAAPVAVGSTVISASFGTMSASTDLTVTAAQLKVVVVTPADAEIGIGGSQQFTATGQFADNSIQDLTNVVTWSSSNANVATISAAGVATTTAAGQATITATLDGVSGATKLTVSNAKLQTVLILPANFDLSQLSTPPQQPPFYMVPRSTLQLNAMGYYSDQSYHVLTGVTWNSSRPSSAVVNGSGLVRSKSKTNSVTIKATWNGYTGSAQLTVSSLKVSSIALSPNPATAAAGTGLQITALATMSDGTTTQDVTSAVRWTTGSYSLAVISRSGYATAVNAGTTTVSATYYNPDGTTVTGSAPLTITSANLTGLMVKPSASTVALGTAQQFTATGTFDDSSTQDLTPLASWSSSDIAVAVMSGKFKGLATSAGPGTASVSATFGKLTGTASMTVTPPTP